MGKPNRKWGSPTKRIVALILVVLGALVLYRFRAVIPPLVIAMLLAFILHPIVGFIMRHLRLSRGIATGLVFFVLVLIILGILAAPAALVQPIRRSIVNLQDEAEQFVKQVDAFLHRPLEVGGYVIDLSPVYTELSSALTSFVRSVAQTGLDVALEIASGAVWLVFILMACFYLVKDADRIIERFDQLAPPGYQDDLVRLRLHITDVWNDFLRGQLLLALAVAGVTLLVCWLLAIPYAGVLGLLAGVMEFLPSIGPTIAAIPAVLVALFSDTPIMGLSNLGYAVVVALAYVLIQQVENNVLVPRILGHNLKLHPLVVITGIIVGGSLAGILGMLLAAPVLATIRVLGTYTFCRLYDRDPFAKLEQETALRPEPSRLGRAAVQAWAGLREKLGLGTDEPERSAPPGEAPCIAEENAGADRDGD